MKSLALSVILAVAMFVIPKVAMAQTHPCDLPTASSGTILVNSPMTVQVCHNSTDTNGAPAVILSWAFYDGATRTVPIMTVDAVASTTGYHLYTFTTVSPLTAGVHTYTMAALDGVGEGTRSAPFALTVTLAPTVPTAPIKLIIR